MRQAVLIATFSVLACAPRVGPPTSPEGSTVDGGVGAPLAASCSNGALDGDESDLDCGGSCSPCAQRGAHCDTPSDCASRVCRSNGCEAALPACPKAFAQCTSFVDATGATASRKVLFPAGGHTYSPRCLRIRVGQEVTFEGSFSSHPLRQSCGPAPLVPAVQQGSSASATTTEALGIFGYYCPNHGDADGSGMAGAIEVVP